MESNYLTYGAVMVITALVAAGLTFAATDQSDALDEQSQTIDDLTTSLNETEAAFADYRDSAESRMQELYDERAELTDRAEEAEAELARYVHPVDVDYQTTYDVNTDLVESKQNIEDSFDFTVNEPRSSFELTTVYEDVEETSDIYEADASVYEGNVKVGAVEYETDSLEDGEYEVTYNVTATDAIGGEFSGTYTLEMEHDFRFDSDGMKEVSFTAEGDEEHFIYLEEK